MASSKAALPALVLLALVCGELVIGGHAQTYIGGPGATLPRTSTTKGGSSPAAAGTTPPPAGGMQLPAYTRPTPRDDGAGKVPAVEEEKASMMHSAPAHDGARPVPVPRLPPTAN
uniref:Uncharacterized protein n=1 Tax=Avena sativa TaxID=4498 RepID=A0ACD5ZAF6_AVESA